MNGTTIFAAMLAVAFAGSVQAGEPAKPESKAPPLAVAPAASYQNCPGGVCRPRPVVDYFATHQPVRQTARYVVSVPVKAVKRSVYVVRHRPHLLRRFR